MFYSFFVFVGIKWGKRVWCVGILMRVDFIRKVFFFLGFMLDWIFITNFSVFGFNIFWYKFLVVFFCFFNDVLGFKWDKDVKFEDFKILLFLFLKYCYYIRECRLYFWILKFVYCLIFFLLYIVVLVYCLFSIMYAFVLWYRGS